MRARGGGGGRYLVLEVLLTTVLVVGGAQCLAESALVDRHAPVPEQPGVCLLGSQLSHSVHGH